MIFMKLGINVVTIGNSNIHNIRLPTIKNSDVVVEKTSEMEAIPAPFNLQSRSFVQLYSFQQY
jgi:hypothetical protein